MVRTVLRLTVRVAVGVAVGAMLGGIVAQFRERHCTTAFGGACAPSPAVWPVYALSIVAAVTAVLLIGWRLERHHQHGPGGRARGR